MARDPSISRHIVDNELIETDLKILDRARARVTYGGEPNALVEWTMSAAWLIPTPRTASELFPVSGEFNAT